MKCRTLGLMSVVSLAACQTPHAPESRAPLLHTVSAQPVYSSTPIPLFPSTGMAWDINEAGHIVGAAQFGSENRAFRWTPDGGLEDLGTLGGNGSVAYAINEFDEVVGTSAVASGEVHAFRWTPAAGLEDLGIVVPPDLVAPGQLRSMDINDSGDIVGSHAGPGGANRAFLLRNGEFQDLGTIIEHSGGAAEPGDMSAAYATNNVGEIVGISIALVPLTDANGTPGDPPVIRRVFRPFLWNEYGGMIGLGTAVSPIELFLGGPATDINDFSLVGWSPGLFAEGCCRVQSAAQWTPSTGWTDLFGLRGPFNAESRASGANNLGFVVGWSEGSDPGVPGLARRPVLWDRHHVIHLLSPSEDVMGSATSINDLGQAVGQIVFQQPALWNVFDVAGRIVALAQRTNDLVNATVVPPEDGVALLQMLDVATSAISDGDPMAAADQLSQYRTRVEDLISGGLMSARGGGRALRNAADNLIRSLTTGT